MAAMGSKTGSGPGLGLRDRVKKITWTIVRLIHGMAEGKPIGNRPVQALFSRKNSRFRKRTLALRQEKKKTELPFSRQADPPFEETYRVSAPVFLGVVESALWVLAWFRRASGRVGRARGT
jgi:hypothetical protein